MPFCSNCGYEVLAREKFCEKCGTPIRISGESKSRIKSFVGEVMTCPGCGANVYAFQIKCFCGLEFRNAKPPKAVKEFETEIKRISQSFKTEMDVDRIITKYIIGFAIPNTREDIISFAAIAASNINPEMMTHYVLPYMTEESFASKKQLSEAWYSMLKKISIIGNKILEDENEKSLIREKLKCINDEISETRKRRKIETAEQGKNLRDAKKLDAKLKLQNNDVYIENKARNRTQIMMICVAIVGIIICFLPALYYIGKANKTQDKAEEEKYNIINLYREAKEDLANNNFDSALEKANQIYPVYVRDKEEWLEKKSELINEINTAKVNYDASKDQSTRVMLQPPADSDDLEGENYNDVITRLKNVGFIYITTKTEEKGWFDDDGEVKTVSINGVTDFDEDDQFPDNSPVIVTYYKK